MENIDEISETPDERPFQLALDNNAQNYLYQAAKWSRLLAVIGFVFVAFLIILFVSWFFGGMLSFFSRMNPYARAIPTGISLIYLLMALIYFFPAYYLYRFATNAKDGLKQNNGPQLSQSLSQLKSFFKFWGIFTLIILIFYLFIFIFFIIGGIGMMHFLH